MDRGTWQATVHGLANSQTPLSYFYLKGLLVKKIPPALHKCPGGSHRNRIHTGQTFKTPTTRGKGHSYCLKKKSQEKISTSFKIFEKCTSKLQQGITSHGSDGHWQKACQEELLQKVWRNGAHLRGSWEPKVGGVKGGQCAGP